MLRPRESTVRRSSASCLAGHQRAWSNGTCKAAPVVIQIPFTEIGDFVYHCHILEHEDDGMMAHIRVLANP